MCPNQKVANLRENGEVCWKQGTFLTNLYSCLISWMSSHILAKWTVANVVQVIFIMTSLSILCQTHLFYVTIVLHWIPGKPENFPSLFLVRAYQFQQLCVFPMMCILHCNTYGYLSLCTENRQYIHIYTHTHTHIIYTHNIYIKLYTYN